MGFPHMPRFLFAKDCWPEVSSVPLAACLNFDILNLFQNNYSSGRSNHPVPRSHLTVFANPR